MQTLEIAGFISLGIFVLIFFGTMLACALLPQEKPKNDDHN